MKIVEEIKYKPLSNYNETDILRLYENVGWKTYTKDIKKLIRAFHKSLYILTAWDKDKLVGLIRIIGDGESIIYIQDILVLEEYQHRGIGSNLLRKTLKKYETVRQKVLLTDNTEKTKTFYKSNSFNMATELNLVAYVKIKKS